MNSLSNKIATIIICIVLEFLKRAISQLILKTYKIKETMYKKMKNRLLHNKYKNMK